MSNLSCEPVHFGLEKFIVYQTTSHLYVVGCDKRQYEYRVLKVRRATQRDLLSEMVTEDHCIYSKLELKDMLAMIHEGNRIRGGLSRIATGYGLLGFVRFLDCYYLCLVSQRRKTGQIGGNTIYGVRSTEIIPIRPEAPHLSASDQSLIRSLVSDVNRRLNPTQREIAEQRYLGLFQFIDLTKDFFFSHTYDLTRTLQHNMSVALPIAMTRCNSRPKAMYAWNSHMCSCPHPPEGGTLIASAMWTLTLTHGAFVQRKCSFFGRIVNVVLIARRSRHFAGTRYLKRGISDIGHVANDVEVEQIVHEEGANEGLFSSFVQVRGSIPIYWTQETSVTMPKPPIVLNRIDPTYASTRRHFADLFRRYSAPVMVLDLTKQAERREREMIVSHEFRRAVEHMNIDVVNRRCMLAPQHIRYCALDFSQISKHRHLNVLDALEDVARWTLQETRFFCSASTDEMSFEDVHGLINGIGETTSCLRVVERTKCRYLRQRGVVRTNCIDCLDRTNVAQFTIGAHALGQMLATSGTRQSPIAEAGNQVILVLMELYSTVGDLISLQYGGSEAHKKMAQQPTAGDITGTTLKHKELLTSIRRYYSNAFTDRLKQDAINVFLGNFAPSSTCGGSQDLWELESDYYLHNFRVQTGSVLSMKAYREPWLTATSDEEQNADDRTRSHPDGRSGVEKSCLQDLQRGLRLRVESRCRRQAQHLCNWWRQAIREFEHNHASGAGISAQPGQQLTLAPLSGAMTRFERLHQPHKLTQFDKIFTHDFFVPCALTKEVRLPPGHDPIQGSQCTTDRSQLHDTPGKSIAAHGVRSDLHLHESVKGSSPADRTVWRKKETVGSTPEDGMTLVTTSRHGFKQCAECTPVHAADERCEQQAEPEQSARVHAPMSHAPMSENVSRDESKITLRRFVRELFPRKPRTVPAQSDENRFLQVRIPDGQPQGTCVELDDSTDLRRLPIDLDGTMDRCLAKLTLPLLEHATFLDTVNPSKTNSPGQHEYAHYARLAQDPSTLSGLLSTYETDGSNTAAQRREGEFRCTLRERDLDSRDVAAVLETTQAASIASTIPRGIYAGLPQTVFARDVVAAVYDELDAIAGIDLDRVSSAYRPEVTRMLARSAGPRLQQRYVRNKSEMCNWGQTVADSSTRTVVNDRSALPHSPMRFSSHGSRAASSLEAPGIIDQIHFNLTTLTLAKRTYTNYLSEDSLAKSRSQHSSDCSIALFSTYFCDNSRRVDLSLRHILHDGATQFGAVGGHHSMYNDPMHPNPSKNWTALADSRMLEATTAPADVDNTHAPRDTQFSRFYEQVSNELYARRGNRYMLFNEVGATSALLSMVAANVQ